MIYNKFGQHILRPYMTHLYEFSSNEEQILKQKNQQIVKFRTFIILEDLVMFTIYLLLLYIVVLYETDKYSFKNNKELNYLLSVNKMYSVKNFHKYVKHGLIHVLQAGKWYGKYKTAEAGLLRDANNKLLGVARIRQHRTIKNACEVNPMMQYLNLTCYPEYDTAVEVKDFGRSWSNSSEDDMFSRQGKIWMYNADEDDEAAAYTGYLTTYSGAGYSLLMGRTKKNSWTNYKYSMKNKWIDRATRVMFIECLTYNVNINLFNAISLVVEKGATGYLEQKFDVFTTTFPGAHLDPNKMVVLICFGIILSILAIKLVLKFWKYREFSTGDYWNVIDGIIILCSIGIIILFSKKTSQIKDMVEDFKKSKNNEFINYFALFSTHNLFLIFSAFLMCIATIRFWKLLRFVKMFLILERTAVDCVPGALAITVLFIVYAASYAFLGTFLFGDEVEQFRSIKNSLPFLMVKSVGLMDDFDYPNPSVGEITYHSSFMIFGTIVMNLYIANVILAYTNAIIYYEPEEYSVKHYLWDQIIYFKTLFLIRLQMLRLRGGEFKKKEKELKVVSPKDYDIRFANCFTIPVNRMEGMSDVIRCRITKPQRYENFLTQDSFQLMLETVASLYSKDSSIKDMFFVMTQKGRKHLLDDSRIVKMEHLTEVMCHQKIVDEEEEMEEEIIEHTVVVERHFNKLEYLAEYLEKILHVLENVN